MTSPAPMRLRLGSIAPDFTATTTQGEIHFHQFIEQKWTVLFSHPEDFTPVCTTEIIALARLETEFKQQGGQLIGLSTDTLDRHLNWISDINETLGPWELTFPIIADENLAVATLYDMIDHDAPNNFDGRLTVRSVFFINPQKRIRAIIIYPHTVGRSSQEIIRILQALVLTTDHNVYAPADWEPTNDVLIPPGISEEQAGALPGYNAINSYLRFRRHP